MAPGGGKRKRGERQFSQDEAPRASPHRPEQLNLAQQNQRNDARGGDRNRRRSRGGQGGQGGQGRQDAPRPAGNGPDAITPSRSVPNAISASNANSQQQRGTPAPERTGTPAQAAPTPAAAREPTPPKGPLPVYAYEHLTPTVLSSWKEKGRQAIVDLATKAEDGESLRASLDGRLSPSDAGDAVKGMIDNQPEDEDYTATIASIVSMLDKTDWRSRVFLPFFTASGLQPETLRESLDMEAMIALGLVRSSFTTNRNRKTTNLLYRQSNYNLLREESEGYAKLITEYFNVATPQPMHATYAEDAFQRIKALVGAFDLDVGRTLDVTMDVFAGMLVKSTRFFVKYLRASSWWIQDEMPESIKWRGQGFDTLPSWALPGSGALTTSPEEKQQAASLREARDVRFWNEVREKGLTAFYEIGARHITNYDDVLELLNTVREPELDIKGNEMNIIKRKRVNDSRKWMRETRLLPPPGSGDAAQLLGFKLRYYASDLRTSAPEDKLPDNLIALAALLIKIGFISLRDLYPHLYPPDERMTDVKAQLEKEKQERDRANRPGGQEESALAKASALSDDMPSVPAVRNLRDAASSKAASPKPDSASEKASTPMKAEEEDKDKPEEPADQKIALLRQLLLIGALPEALYILGRFPG
ncbi:THO2 plays a role in transcriptional elongation [Taxawa tesnikishii (nom. ined.)]|nr:THO2 plays a role in transcriptional elongation [Dothideales sp. JES 119]